MDKAMIFGITVISSVIIGGFVQSGIELAIKAQDKQNEQKSWQEGFDAGREFQRMLDQATSLSGQN